MNNKLIYLAQPYTGTDDEMQHRYEIGCEVSAKLMREGHFIFSPIAHGHGIADFGLPREFEYWRGYCELTLGRCDELFLLMIDGWQASTGVEHELSFADQRGIPIKILDQFGEFHNE